MSPRAGFWGYHDLAKPGVRSKPVEAESSSYPSPRRALLPRCAAGHQRATPGGTVTSPPL